MLRLMIKFCLLVMICSATTFSGRAQVVEAQAALTAGQLVEKGRDFARAKQFDQAVESYKQAIKLDPNSAAAYQGLGSVYISMGRSADAVEPNKAGLRIAPDSTAMHYNLGVSYANLRRTDEALAELNVARQLSPNDARIAVQIGGIYYASGRIEDALAINLEARRLDSTIPTVHYNIGLIEMRLGKFSEAIAPFEECLNLDPQYRNARYFLSDTYSKVGRYRDAAESWGKFLAIVPNGPEALTKRAWNYLYEGGHGKEAAADAQTFLKVYGWKDNSTAYLAVMANIGDRQAGMNDEAQAVIVEAAKKADHNLWAYNFVRYFNGEISGDELMQLAADNDKKTEAHTYLGMDALLKSKPDEARTHFLWVKNYGNKRFFEFPLAIEELKRIGK